MGSAGAAVACLAFLGGAPAQGTAHPCCLSIQVKSISSTEVQKPFTPPLFSRPIPHLKLSFLPSCFLMDSFLPASISSLSSFTFPPLHPPTTACTSAAHLCICAAGGPDPCTSFPLLKSCLMINLPLPQSLLGYAYLVTQAYSSCSQHLPSKLRLQ